MFLRTTCSSGNRKTHVYKYSSSVDKNLSVVIWRRRDDAIKVLFRCEAYAPGNRAGLIWHRLWWDDSLQCCAWLVLRGKDATDRSLDYLCDSTNSVRTEIYLWTPPVSDESARVWSHRHVHLCVLVQSLPRVERRLRILRIKLRERQRNRGTLETALQIIMWLTGEIIKNVKNLNASLLVPH